MADEVEHEEDLEALHDDITEFIADIKKNMHWITALFGAVSLWYLMYQNWHHRCFYHKQ